MLQITGGILGIQDDGKNEDEDGVREGWRMRRTPCFTPGGWGGVVVARQHPPRQSHAFEWVHNWVRVITALHHAIDKVEKRSLDHPTPRFRQT
jgi:hypothetical protein